MSVEHVISWRNPATMDREFERFDSEEDARARVWAVSYPWNNYTLWRSVEEVHATAKYVLSIRTLSRLTWIRRSRSLSGSGGGGK